MKLHWREWFARANMLAWQAIPVPESYIEEFIAGDLSNCAETMYQAFKARMIEELGLAKPEERGE